MSCQQLIIAVESWNFFLFHKPRQQWLHMYCAGTPALWAVKKLSHKTLLSLLLVQQGIWLPDVKPFCSLPTFQEELTLACKQMHLCPWLVGCLSDTVQVNEASLQRTCWVQTDYKRSPLLYLNCRSCHKSSGIQVGPIQWGSTPRPASPFISPWRPGRISNWFTGLCLIYTREPKLCLQSLATK